MKPFEISQKAYDDLLDTWLYIAERSSENQADKFIDKITEKLHVLAHSPAIGRLRPEIAEDIRSFPIGNYVIFYTYNTSPIFIIRVLNQKRDLDHMNIVGEE